MTEFSGLKISIITISFNSEKYIEQAIKSVIDQNWPDLEYIIIDGGSTDKTVDIIRKYEKYLRCWISEPDRGISHAFNKGLVRATGEWIGILNSDDFYQPDCFAQVSNFVKSSRSGIVCGSVCKVSMDGMQIYKTYQSSIDPAYPDQFIMTHPATFVRKDIYERVGLFNEQYKLAMDYDWILRAVRAGVIPVCISNLLSSQRVGGRSYYFLQRANIEKYKAIVSNGFGNMGVHFRMISYILVRCIKRLGSRIKGYVRLSSGPDNKKNF